MSAPVTPPPAATQVPALSEPQRIADMYYAPSRTFEDLRRSAKWWGPFLMIVVVSYLVVFTIQAKIGWDGLTDSIYANMSEKQKERIEQAPPERQPAIRAQVMMTTKIFNYLIPVIALVLGLIIAAVLMATFTFGLGKEVTFWQSTAIVLYSWMPGLIKSILFIVTMFVGLDMASFNIENPVATNAAFWMNKADMPALYALAQKFDVFNIWQAILMGMGFAIVTKSKTSTGIGVVLGWLVVVALVSAGLATALN